MAAGSLRVIGVSDAQTCRLGSVSGGEFGLNDGQEKDLRQAIRSVSIHVIDPQRAT